ncbi:MAG: hypothetical protein NZ742_07865, partial [Acidobacteria bacterium]|nr:hypothetical protein [Acidobacteriota bacterium]MDW7984757.1 hypothetical protein [Acidobacteriota bacterium]
LLPATFVMGGTYPAMVKALTSEFHTLGRVAATVYALNTWGASLGPLVAIFGFFPQWGLSGTNLRAALASLGIAALCYLLSIGSVRSSGSARDGLAPSSAPWTVAPYPSALRPWVLGALFGAGGASFVCETLWIRYFTVVLGSTTNAFALMLSAVIAGIALGSSFLARIESWLASRRRHDMMFVVTLGAAGVALAGSLGLYSRIPFWVARFSGIFRPDPVAYPVYELGRYALCFIVMAVPAFFFGMLLHLGVKLVVRDPDHAAEDTGRAYAFNSSGNVVGALLGGFVILPHLGLSKGMVLCALFCIAMAFLLWGQVSARRFLGWALALGATGAIGVLDFRWDPRIFALEAPRLHFLGRNAEAVVRAYRVLHYKEDPGGQILVVEDRNSKNVIAYLNGKAEIAGYPPYDSLSVHLTMLLFPRTPQRVLVLGAGVGISAATVFRYPVGHVVGVEILQGLRPLSPLFAPFTAPLRDRPAYHYTFVFEDAKTYMLWVPPQSFDIVIGQAANPWITSIGNLYTLESFQRVRRVLKEDGIYSQIFYVGESTNTAFLVLLRTLREVFPYIYIFRLNPRVAIFLASLNPIRPNWQVVAPRVQMPLVQQDLAFAGLTDFLPLLLLQSHTPEGVDRLLQSSPPGPLNTDDNQWIQLRAPRLYFTGELMDVLDATDQRAHGPWEGLFASEYLRWRTPSDAEWDRARQWVHGTGGFHIPIDWERVRTAWVGPAGAE